MSIVLGCKEKNLRKQWFRVTVSQSVESLFRLLRQMTIMNRIQAVHGELITKAQNSEAIVGLIVESQNRD